MLYDGAGNPAKIPRPEEEPSKRLARLRDSAANKMQEFHVLCGNVEEPGKTALLEAFDRVINAMTTYQKEATLQHTRNFDCKPRGQ